ncbi:MAG TPA: helix-turn-helix transcriptional regulator [Pseudonocardiaceae bacterium]|nr:helix-turn-helix transcriptional regulator [Pseudonocardiaceae bacterium]
MADVLVVRASGAGAARAAMAGAPRPAAENIQVIMTMALPSVNAEAEFPGCSVAIQLADDHAVAVLTVATTRLSIDFAELQPLMFQPVPVEPPLAVLFGSAVGQLLAVRGAVDQHGAGHYLVGLVELLLRSALRSHLLRADTAAARYREAIEYVQRHLSDPDLTAERVADALFVSRRRLYQLFDDGEGISGRIRRLRIERAKEMLGDPARARAGIGELSRQCGFVNSAHFSRTFRKLVGQTPREYREARLGVEGHGGDHPSEQG